MIDISALTAAEIRGGIAERRFSAREVAEAALDRIDALEGRVRAFTQVTPELALEAAARIDKAAAEGASLPPLAGVPVAFKDNLNLIGTRTTCSSKMLENYESMFDSTAASRLIEAGGLPVGKCNMDEFAFGSSTENSAFGPTHNPWDLERVPGGSSGGSAAAVAAGMATIALGSDTGGSIRQPAALTGTVGLKPTYGRVSRYGAVAFASSLDQVGPFARTVGECALALNAISGKDPRDATSVARPAEDFTAVLAEGVAGLRVGLVTNLLETEGCQEAVRESVRAAAETFAVLGADVGEVELPNALHGVAAIHVIGPAEASSNLARFDGVRYGHRAQGAEDMMDLYLRSRAEGFGSETMRRIMLGTYVLSAEQYDEYYVQALKVRTLIKRDFTAAFERFDVLLTPTSSTVAFKMGERADDPLAMYLSDIYTIPVNLAGNCAVSVPSGFDDELSLPIGLQIVGGHFAEATVLRAAAAFEAAAGLDLVPPLAR
ncbi:MAG: Asp-tRNA(Asn)/Glu-tRNA(Gln) amidotransferase subunit GatA [Coriobacteriia bacterium]|jgi:aspartyl-tRNA(Asn)/glutamyl-tRNA(Gln) amidotransferase subunit A|nr:Asp-tRNA(Asn)/Glu-tRNA(Gln) amidotransferase subunit GatA [Coriobacteriia bacterium]